MKNKKLLCILLGSTFMLGLCACGNGQNNNSDQPTNGQTEKQDEKALVSYHTPEAIKQRGEVIVGINKGGISFFDKKDGTKGGYEGDIANAIAKEIGEDVKVTFVEGDRDELLAKLEKGEVDIVLASLPANSSIREKFTLSKSYWPGDLKAYPIYVSKSKNETYTSLNSFSNAKIAFVKNNYTDDYIKEYLPNATPVEFENADECIEKLKNNEVDAIVVDSNSASSIEKSGKKTDDVVKSNITMPEKPEDVGVFIAVMKDNAQLETVINTSIDKNKENGEMAKWIENAYNDYLSQLTFGEDNNAEVNVDDIKEKPEENKTQPAQQEQKENNKQ